MYHCLGTLGYSCLFYSTWISSVCKCSQMLLVVKSLSQFLHFVFLLLLFLSYSFMLKTNFTRNCDVFPGESRKNWPPIRRLLHWLPYRLPLNPNPNLYLYLFNLGQVLGLESLVEPRSLVVEFPSLWLSRPLFMVEPPSSTVEFPLFGWGALLINLSSSLHGQRGHFSRKIGH